MSNQNFVGCKWFKPLPRKWNGKEHLKETASHSACAPLIFWNWVFCQVNSAVLKTSRTKQPGQRLVAQSSLDKVYADHPTPLASQWSVGKKMHCVFRSAISSEKKEYFAVYVHQYIFSERTTSLSVPCLKTISGALDTFTYLASSDQPLPPLFAGSTFARKHSTAWKGRWRKWGSMRFMLFSAVHSELP